MGNLWRSFAWAGIALVITTQVWGQASTTSLRGTVSDPQAAVVAGATVKISNASTGFSQATETNEQGVYQFFQIPPGTYTLTVSKSGFASVKEENLQLMVNLPAAANVVMNVHGETTTVEVTGERVQVNTQDATLGNAFGTSQIAELPFEGRDPVSILSLQPGVSFVGKNVDQNYDSRGGSVSGARSDQTNIVLDGIDNNDQTHGYAFTGALRSTLDSLQEFRVTTSNANADAGRSSGAQVVLVTKSGTNKIHGSFYEYNRSTIGVANDWFNKHTELKNGLPNVPGKLIRNTFGATFGGPIRKDHLFFFAAYEGQRTRESQEVTRIVPSDNLRNGMISYLSCGVDPTCHGGNDTPQIVTLSQAQIQSMDQNCYALGTCPYAANNPNNWGGPNPAVLTLFNTYPRANATNAGDGLNLQGFSFSAPTPGKQDTYIVKLDYNINQNHRVFVRGGLVNDHVTLQAPQFPGQPANEAGLNNSKGLIFGYTATISSNLVNNVRYGLIRQGTDIAGLQTRPYIQFNFMDSIQGFTPSQRVIVPVHNLVDDFTWVKGKHTLQFGGNLSIVTNNRSWNSNSFSQVVTNPQWIQPSGKIAGSGGSLDPAAFGFPSVYADQFQFGFDYPMAAMTGLLLQSFSNYNLTKSGQALGEGVSPSRYFRSREFELYAQDSWHATPQLVLTAGLRYTLLQPPFETTGTQVAPTISLNDFFNRRAAAMAQGLTYDPVITFDLSGQANGRKPYWAWDYKDIAPRFSFAWSPKAESGLLHRLFGGAGMTSVRSGYGIYYDHFGQGITNTFDRNGSFGLATSLENNPNSYSVDDALRFTDLYTIPSQLIQPAPQGGFPQTPAAGANIYWGLDDKLKTPYSHVFDFSISRELPKGFALEVAYVGRLGRRLLQEADLAMPLNIKDKQSGMDYFTAATLFAKAAENGVPIQNFGAGGTIPFWENVFPGATGVPIPSDPAFQCAPGVSTFTGPPTATQAMYNLYACNLHNETYALYQADVPGVDQYAGPGGCFPSCATINGQITPYAFYHSQFSSLYSWRSLGTSSYHGLQVMLRRRLTSGLQWDFNYTYSKSMDIGSNAERINSHETLVGFSQVINSWAPKQLMAVSDFDTTHQINTNWVYQLPVGRGKKFGAGSGTFVNALIGGWEWSGLARWTSGFPTSMYAYCCYPTNWYLESGAILSGPRPKTGAYIDKDGDPNIFKDPGTAINSFRYSYPGESGQRNELRGPGYFGIDSGLSKSWTFNESQALKFSWEVFNVTNSVRFDVNPLPQNNGQIDRGPAFGKYTSTLTNPRVMEFALRYSF
jgi:hypothetical protein